nr:DNA cytosine methyltransferase [candidate division Zixibacteria bacterium]
MSKCWANNYVNDEVVLRYGELFCGPGGLALGALKAKIKKNGIIYRLKHIWATDYDFDSCQTYRKNICPKDPQSVIHEDVRKLDLESLGPIDVFAYGFPCNDFSIVGESKGFDGEFGPLYTYGVKILNIFRPKIFVAENVSGLRSANNGNAFNVIMNDLESAGAGYNLTTNLYKFEHYGVPQTRHRILIIGIEKSLGLRFHVPKPTTVEKPPTASQAIEHPPISANAHNHEITRQSKKVIERLERIKPGENAWNADLPEELQLNVKGARLSHIYRRLHPDRPSYTITGSGGGGTHGYHWKESRALTNRERARIQTFPDDFIFMGSKESVRKQIGMAVPPMVSELIFNCILKTIVGTKYKHLDFSELSLENSQLELSV